MLATSDTEPHPSPAPPARPDVPPAPAQTAVAQSPVPPPPQICRRRRGKVARLPHRLRELVNLMLRDGLSYAEISSKLAEHGHNLSPDNLSRWHSGGHRTWLTEQDLLDDQHARFHFATRVLTEKDGQAIQEASIRIAILRMYSLLLDFNPAVLKDRIADNPGAYARILNALVKLSSGALNLERVRLEQPQVEP